MVSTFVYYIVAYRVHVWKYNAVWLIDFVPRFIIARVKDIKRVGFYLLFIFTLYYCNSHFYINNFYIFFDIALVKT